MPTAAAAVDECHLRHAALPKAVILGQAVPCGADTAGNPQGHWVKEGKHVLQNLQGQFTQHSVINFCVLLSNVYSKGTVLRD